MPKFTQKYTLVTFLESVEDKSEFFWKEWPLHVTIMNTFAVDWSDDLSKQLSLLLANNHSITLRANESVNWGKNNVTLLEKTQEIADLHIRIYNLLVTSGAVFNEPQYVGAHYSPHSTVQKHAKVSLGETVKIATVSVIDMFPEGDGYRRKVVRTLPLSTTI